MKNKVKFIDLDGNIRIPSENDEVKFRPSVYVFVKNSNDQLLMIIDEKSGKWELPGGGVNIGEELNECGVREVLEETGYEIEINDIKPLEVKTSLAYYRGNKSYNHVHCFFMIGNLISEKQGEQNFDLGENIIKVEFVDLNKIKNLEIIYYQKEVILNYINL